MPQPFDPEGRALDPKTFAKKLAEHLAASGSPRRSPSRRARRGKASRPGNPRLAGALSGSAIIAASVAAGLAVAMLSGWVAGLLPTSDAAPDEPVVFPSQVTQSTMAGVTTITPAGILSGSTTTLFGDAPGSSPITPAVPGAGSAPTTPPTTTGPGPTTPTTGPTATTTPTTLPTTTTTAPEPTSTTFPASTTTTICWPPGQPYCPKP